MKPATVSLLDHTPRNGEVITLDDGRVVTVARIDTVSGTRRRAPWFRACDEDGDEFLVIWSTYNGRG